MKPEYVYLDWWLWQQIPRYDTSLPTFCNRTQRGRMWARIVDDDPPVRLLGVVLDIRGKRLALGWLAVELRHGPPPRVIPKYDWGMTVAHNSG